MLKQALQRISANASQLAADQARPRTTREMARDASDLSELIAVWPVPDTVKLDRALKRQLLRLCRRTGVAVCGKHQCAVKEGPAADADCDIGLPGR